mmetsp:Transcript_2273/g.4137  ORF Transcript_2273/g.4137 Transcript_2273/m.4137 type:complete len:93 (-) Transcript_2273:675-953(-)
MIMMSFCSLPSYAVLRCLEIMHQFSPPGTVASMKNYCLYFCFPVQVLFDPKTRTPLKPTKNDQSIKLRSSIVEGILLTLLTSLLLESKFEPF